jgi:LysM repeat protein
LVTTNAWATVTNTYVLNVKNDAANPPTEQNGSIVDTGTSSGFGNVGIGSLNPGVKLDVLGTVRATNFIGSSAGLTGLPVGANPSQVIGILANNGSATTFMRSDATPAIDEGIIPSWTGEHEFSGSPYAIIVNGIISGASPNDWQVDASGNAQFGDYIGGPCLTISNGQIQADCGAITIGDGSGGASSGAGTASFARGNMTISSNGGASFSSGAATIDGSGRVGASQFITNGGNNTQVVLGDGTLGTYSTGSGTVTSVGLSSTNSTLTIGSTPVTTSGTITADINLAHANTFTGQQIFNSANVGINSATPGQRLDVTGTVRATAFIGNGAQLTGISSSQWTTTNTNDVYLPNSGNVGIGTTKTTTAGLTVMNGNVGIGTWAPNGLLNASSLKVITSTTCGSTPATIIGSIQNTGGDECAPFAINQTDPNGNIYFRVGTTTGAIEVGGTSTTGFINTKPNTANTTPMAFEINNTTKMELSANGGLALGSTYYSTDPGANNAIIQGNLGIGTTLVTTSALTVMNGNVGIGTWVPAGLLDVNRKLNVFSSGNVGIGSVNPGQVLDVQGTVSATNFNEKTFTNGSLTKYNSSGDIVSAALIPGTLTDTKLCSYTSSGTALNCTTTAPTVTVNAGTGNQVAYYSGASTISSTSDITFAGSSTNFLAGGVFTNFVTLDDGSGNSYFGNISSTGSQTVGYNPQSSTYAVVASDYFVNATSGTFTITLPSAIGIAGKVYKFKNSGSGVVTIATTSSQTIDGSTTKTLAATGTLTVIAASNNWVIMP